MSLEKLDPRISEIAKGLLQKLDELDLYEAGLVDKKYYKDVRHLFKNHLDPAGVNKATHKQKLPDKEFRLVRTRTKDAVLYILRVK